MRFAALVFALPCLALAGGACAEGTLLGQPIQANSAALLGAGASPAAGAAPGGAYPGFYGANPAAYGSDTGVLPGLTSRVLTSNALPLRNLSLHTLNMTKQRTLRHRWAVGLDSIPAAALVQASGGVVAVPSALSVRWWATDRLALEILASGNYDSAEAARGELSPLVSNSPGNAVYAGGVGLRYIISQLSHDLLSQLVFKASGAQTAVSVTDTSGQATESTLAVFLGAGFEAFIPGWDWLSVEAEVGVTGFSQSLTPQGGGGARTVSGLGLGGNGFSPIAVGVHAYF